jgi:hypothetical protein
MKITSKTNKLHFSMNRKQLLHVYLLVISTFMEHQCILQTYTALAHALSNCKLYNAVILYGVGSSRYVMFKLYSSVSHWTEFLQGYARPKGRVRGFRELEYLEFGNHAVGCVAHTSLGCVSCTWLGVCHRSGRKVCEVKIEGRPCTPDCENCRNTTERAVV